MRREPGALQGQARDRPLHGALKSEAASDRRRGGNLSNCVAPADAARNALSAASGSRHGGRAAGSGASVGAGHAGTAGAGGTTGAPAVARRAGRTWLTTTGSVPTAVVERQGHPRAETGVAARLWLTTTGGCCASPREPLVLHAEPPELGPELGLAPRAAAGSPASASFSTRSRSASARSCLSTGARRHAAQAARETDVNSSPPGEIKLYVVPSARRRARLPTGEQVVELGRLDARQPSQMLAEPSRAATSETRDTFNGGAAAAGAGASAAAVSSRRRRGRAEDGRGGCGD